MPRNLTRGETAYDFLAHGAVASDLLPLRTAELLRAGRERLIQVVLLTSSGTLRIVGVVHCELW
jgi:hypothetical protein